MKNGNLRKRLLRVAILFLGLLIAHFGITLFIPAELGSDPFGILIQGIFRSPDRSLALSFLTHGRVHFAVSLLITLGVPVSDGESDPDTETDKSETDNRGTMEHKGTKAAETGRLIRRPFCMDDIEAAYRNWTSDEKVTEFLRWSPHSGNVTKKCGLIYEGTLRQADYSNKGIVDACVYSLLKSNWERNTRR